MRKELKPVWLVDSSDTLNLSQGVNIASPKLSFRYYKLEKSRDSPNVFYIELDGKSRSSIKTDVIHMTENAKRTIVWLVFATGLDLPHKGYHLYS